MVILVRNKNLIWITRQLLDIVMVQYLYPSLNNNGLKATYNQQVTALNNCAKTAHSKYCVVIISKNKGIS